MLKMVLRASFNIQLNVQRENEKLYMDLLSQAEYPRTGNGFRTS